MAQSDKPTKKQMEETGYMVEAIRGGDVGYRYKELLVANTKRWITKEQFNELLLKIYDNVVSRQMMQHPDTKESLAYTPEAFRKLYPKAWEAAEARFRLQTEEAAKAEEDRRKFQQRLQEEQDAERIRTMMEADEERRRFQQQLQVEQDAERARMMAEAERLQRASAALAAAGGFDLGGIYGAPGGGSPPPEAPVVPGGHRPNSDVHIADDFYSADLPPQVLAHRTMVKDWDLVKRKTHADKLALSAQARGPRQAVTKQDIEMLICSVPEDFRPTSFSELVRVIGSHMGVNLKFTAVEAIPLNSYAGPILIETALIGMHWATGKRDEFASVIPELDRNNPDGDMTPIIRGNPWTLPLFAYYYIVMNKSVRSAFPFFSLWCRMKVDFPDHRVDSFLKSLAAYLGDVPNTNTDASAFYLRAATKIRVATQAHVLGPLPTDEKFNDVVNFMKANLAASYLSTSARSMKGKARSPDVATVYQALKELSKGTITLSM